MEIKLVIIRIRNPHFKSYKRISETVSKYKKYSIALFNIELSRLTTKVV